MAQSFYDFKATSLQGKEKQMEEYKGKVVVVVNTASKCGLTPQYEGLEKLYKEYKDKGLVVLGFPCNQFGGQEPGGEKEISEGCLINYGVSFPMFSKIDVNGEHAHPIYKYLKSELKGFPAAKSNGILVNLCSIGTESHTNVSLRLQNQRNCAKTLKSYWHNKKIEHGYRTL